MNLRNKQGQIDWKNHHELIYLMYSIMTFMRDGRVEDVSSSEFKEMCAKTAEFMSQITGETITQNHVDTQLMVTGDVVFKKHNPCHMRNIKIGIDTGYYNNRLFNWDVYAKFKGKSIK